MAVSPTHFRALIAVESVVVDIGKGAGAAISTSNVDPHVPQQAGGTSTRRPTASFGRHNLYGSLDSQSSYPIGTPARDGVNQAYGETQRVIFITATSLLAIAWIAVLFWKDIDQLLNGVSGL